MKAYVLKSIGQLNYQEEPKPVIKEGEVLVEVHAAGICGSDVPRIFQTGTYHFPTIPGHEFSGRVVESFDENDRIWIGKRVGVFPLIPCGTCFTCREKQYEMCRHYNYLGSRCNGGFAEYVAVPVQNLIELPTKMSFEEAAMLEPSSVSLHAVRRVDLSKVNTVALFGLGTIGILVTQWLHIFGVKTVYASGHNNGHGNLMKKISDPAYRYLNTDQDTDVVEIIMSETNQVGVDLAIDCTGDEDAVNECLRVVRPCGQLLLVGNPKDDIKLEKDAYWKILRHQIQVTGTWNSTFNHTSQDDWHTVIENCCNGKLHLKEMITHRLEFDKLAVGLNYMKDNKEYRNKIMICR